MMGSSSNSPLSVLPNPAGYYVACHGPSKLASWFGCSRGHFIVTNVEVRLNSQFCQLLHLAHFEQRNVTCNFNMASGIHGVNWMTIFLRLLGMWGCYSILGISEEVRCHPEETSRTPCCSHQRQDQL